MVTTEEEQRREMREVEIAGESRVRYSVEALSMMHRNMGGRRKQSVDKKDSRYDYYSPLLKPYPHIVRCLSLHIKMKIR